MQVSTESEEAAAGGGGRAQRPPEPRERPQAPWPTAAGDYSPERKRAHRQRQGRGPHA